MVHVVFVVPFVFETSLRFLRAAVRQPDIHVSLVSQDPLTRFAPEIVDGLDAHWQVADALSAQHLVDAVRGLQARHGVRVDHLIGVLEQLQTPLAEAREALGLPGLGVAASHAFRDKSVMKTTLREAGLPCARHAVATTVDEALAFARDLGGPMVVKPPAGAGAVDTYRVEDAEQLAQALRVSPPSRGKPVMLEEFIVGREFSFDAVMVDGDVVWHSISHYHPSPLEVVSEPWIQWCVMLPADIDGPEYAPIREAAPKALRALGLETGLAHMEWFRRDDGSIAISEVGARPPGAQFTSLLSWAHDHDMYAAWVRLMAGLGFACPPRRYACGAAYLRGQGRGSVVAIHGLDEAQRELGDLVVDVKLPAAGQARASGYEGEGYVIVRHERTDVVARALERIVSLIRVELG